MSQNIRNPVQAIEIDKSLIENVKLKKKQTTIREGIRIFNLENSIIYNIEEQFVFPIKITSVKIFALDKIPENFIFSEGYKNFDDFFLAMLKFYPNITKKDLVTVISWI